MRRLLYALGVLMFIVHAALFWAIFRADLVGDLSLHASIVDGVLETGALPGNFLLYATTAVLAGLQDSSVAIEAAMTVALAAAAAGKYLISGTIALQETDRSPRALLGVVALLSLAFSLPTDEVYLGQLPPNVWHNSTTVFVMPFAVALFWASAQFVRTGERRWLWATGAAGALNVAAKPSLLLALLPVFAVLALARFRLTRAGVEALSMTAAVGFALVLQYLYIYKSGAHETLYDAIGFGDETETGLGIEPFRVWSFYSNSIPLSVLASLAFPITALAVYRRRLLESDLVRYALALSVASFAIFALVTETGVRRFDGNFAWQVIISSYLLFLAVLVRVWSLWDFQRARLASSTVAGAFGVHVVAGAGFLTYWFVNRTYV